MYGASISSEATNEVECSTNTDAQETRQHPLSSIDRQNCMVARGDLTLHDCDYGVTGISSARNSAPSPCKRGIFASGS